MNWVQPSIMLIILGLVMMKWNVCLATLVDIMDLFGGRRLIRSLLVRDELVHPCEFLVCNALPCHGIHPILKRQIIIQLILLDELLS